MTPRQIFQMTATDTDSRDEIYVFLRSFDHEVAMFFSLRKDGDLDLQLSLADADRLIDLLKNAREAAAAPV